MHEKTRTARRIKALRLAWLVAGSLIASTALAQPAQDKKGDATAANAAAPAMRKTSPYHPASTPDSAANFYQAVWGIDGLHLRRTDSGHLIRFSYRVVDAVRAAALGEERSAPALIDLRRGVSLKVPTLENVGDLRQKGKPVAGKEYWMVFSNKGNVVKAGDRVSVVIGSFHADSLLVE